MDDDDAALLACIMSIVRGDERGVSAMLANQPTLASIQIRSGATRQNAAEYFIAEIAHHVYRGDTAIHFAAAAYRPRVVGMLVAAGGSVATVNRRGAQALHYAADGAPGTKHWNPVSQSETVRCLIELGADPDAHDKNGTTPLLRAVRNRCSAAVEALLDGGANVEAVNASGSTALQLASWTTGRGGSGSLESKAEQLTIVELLAARRVR